MKMIGLTRAGGCALAVGTLALAGCGTPTGSAAGSPSHPGAPATASSGLSSGQSTPTTTGSATPQPSQPVSGGGVSTFQVLSMTFVSDSQGFALGTFQCGSRRCDALLTTTNGGAIWSKLPAPTARPAGPYSTCPSGQPCVSQVRFATPLVGYAFDPSLFVTTDGGRLWRRVPGLNVTSLEAADGTVARVASAGTGCAGMPYDVQSAPVGSIAWHLLPAPRILMICPPVLYRQGQRLVLAGYGNPAGGVRATAQIVRSDNGGATWASEPDQCGGKDGYASAVTIAPPDVLVLLCRHQMPNAAGDFGAAWVRISVNGGASFGPDRVVRAPGLTTRQITGYQVAAASSSRLLVVAAGEQGNRVYLTENGGLTWSATLASGSSAAAIILVGFEDPVTARIAQGDLVWTTYDGGLHWTTDHFPS
jgi:hypothetical protein